MMYEFWAPYWSLILREFPNVFTFQETVHNGCDAMSMRLIQFRDESGERAVAMLDGTRKPKRVGGHSTTYDLARAAIRAGVGVVEFAASHQSEEEIDVTALVRERRLLAPIDHPDSAHLFLTGTGLTHLGSAESRDKMHKATTADALTDSMRMFKMGLDGGKPEAGEEGVQPEWFYKGDGSVVVPSSAPLRVPAFALDGGEEPEIAGIYIIDDRGNPFRLGFCLANEFSDHVIERGNYLWLAHSKLRSAALGAELLTGDLPTDIRGTSRIWRAGKLLWEKPFLTGEENMSHSIANLERHHFKYRLFRRPGDVHVHFFGTATLSFSDGVKTEPGDVFEITATGFDIPLRNPLVAEQPEEVRVTVL